MALTSAHMSKDPSTKVGACIVGPHGNILSTGFNGFPRNVADDLRLHNRADKLDIIVHAEMNAVLAAARVGTALYGSTMYVAATDGTQGIWGGPPCVRCAVECMQAGIVAYVSWPGKPELLTRWADSIAKAKLIIAEAGLAYREVPLPEYWCNENAELYCETHVHCPTCPLKHT